MDVDDLFDCYRLDDVIPGICTNEGCSFTAGYEPDQDEGWCDECQTPTVASAFILSGVI